MMFRHFVLCLALLCASGCQHLRAHTSAPPEAEVAEAPPADFKPDILGAAEPASDLYAEAKIIGTITDPQLAEISGLTPSRTAKGLWWTHNDSGNDAKLYVLNAQGKKLGEFTVTSATNDDWEDMAGYKTKDGQAMLYLADSGNNGGTRDELALYRLPEPNLAKAQSGATAEAEKFTFRYPDGKHDAEALLVDPATGRPYLVTKTSKPPCAVYRFPLPLQTGSTMTLEKVRGPAIERISRLVMVTGGAVAPDGQRLVIRTYFTALELARTGGAFESLFDATPQIIKIPLERQGEAISYTLDGKALVTTSEKLPAPLFQMVRTAK